MAQITRDARTKEEEVGRARGRKIEGKRQGKRAKHQGPGTTISLK